MTEDARMKIMVFGAGVLGSLYAARLQEAGHDVTVVARGKRFEDIQQHGIVLEYFDTGKRTTTPVTVLDRMPAVDQYDLCLVPVRKTQLDSALAVLKTNQQIPAFLFMVNTAEGPEQMISALGRKRVMLGFANAGGERDGHIVRMMVARGKPVTMGELDGQKSERLQRIAAAFKSAGFPVEFSRDMDAWLRHHVALVGPLANALYMAGGSNYELARNREMVRKALRGVREAVRVVRAHGFPIQPRELRLVLALPDFILVPLLQRLLGTKIMDIGGTRHALAAREEMKALNEELFTLAREIGVENPAMTELHRYSDPEH